MVPTDPVNTKREPRTFVFKRGNVGSSVAKLVEDLREVMLPFTAPHLKVLSFLSISFELFVESTLGEKVQLSERLCECGWSIGSIALSVTF